MSRNTWIVFAIICVAVLGGLIFLSRQDRPQVGDVDTSKIIPASKASGNIEEHTFGAEKGKALLIEYGDFQCPACGSAHPILKAVKEEFKDDLTFVFRNNPITQIHPNAKVAAAAAEAAGLQGMYWEMHDALYDKQNDWTNASIDERVGYFVSLAEDVGIKDIDKFKKDMESKDVSAKITFDLELGRKDNVTGTPTIFLDGKQLSNDEWTDVLKMRELVQKAIKD